MYRIRIKCGGEGQDRSLEAWNEGLVGIWIGKASVNDFQNICNERPGVRNNNVTNATVLTYLNDVNEAAGSPRNFTKTSIAAARRLISLQEDSWMLTYDSAHRVLLLGQVTNEAAFDAPRLNDVFDGHQEKLLARRITNKVAYRLVDLPEAFLVLTMWQGILNEIDLASELAQILISQGLNYDVTNGLHEREPRRQEYWTIQLKESVLRGRRRGDPGVLTIEERDSEEMLRISESVRVLSDQRPADHVTRYVTGLNRNDIERWFDILGPVSWEGICCAYLILMHDFLPTCRATGGTFADYDIVGKDRDGKRIFAQCKKDPNRYTVTQQDRAAFADLEEAKGFFFAYGGVRGCALPDKVKIISREDILKWLREDPKGQKYRELLRDEVATAELALA